MLLGKLNYIDFIDQWISNKLIFIFIIYLINFAAIAIACIFLNQKHFLILFFWLLVKFIKDWNLTKKNKKIIKNIRSYWPDILIIYFLNGLLIVKVVFYIHNIDPNWYCNFILIFKKNFNYIDIILNGFLIIYFIIFCKFVNCKLRLKLFKFDRIKILNNSLIYFKILIIVIFLTYESFRNYENRDFIFLLNLMNLTILFKSNYKTFIHFFMNIILIYYLCKIILSSYNNNYYLIINLFIILYISILNLIQNFCDNFEILDKYYIKLNKNINLKNIIIKNKILIDYFFYKLNHKDKMNIFTESQFKKNDHNKKIHILSLKVLLKLFFNHLLEILILLLSLKMFKFAFFYGYYLITFLVYMFFFNKKNYKLIIFICYLSIYLLITNEILNYFNIMSLIQISKIKIHLLYINLFLFLCYAYNLIKKDRIKNEIKFEVLFLFDIYILIFKFINKIKKVLVLFSYLVHFFIYLFSPSLLNLISLVLNFIFLISFKFNLKKWFIYNFILFVIFLIKFVLINEYVFVFLQNWKFFNFNYLANFNDNKFNQTVELFLIYFSFQIYLFYVNLRQYELPEFNTDRFLKFEFKIMQISKVIYNFAKIFFIIFLSFLNLILIVYSDLTIFSIVYFFYLILLILVCTFFIMLENNINLFIFKTIIFIIYFMNLSLFSIIYFLYFKIKIFKSDIFNDFYNYQNLKFFNINVNKSIFKNVYFYVINIFINIIFFHLISKIKQNKKTFNKNLKLIIHSIFSLKNHNIFMKYKSKILSIFNSFLVISFEITLITFFFILKEIKLYKFYLGCINILFTTILTINLIKFISRNNNLSLVETKIKYFNNHLINKIKRELNLSIFENKSTIIYERKVMKLYYFYIKNKVFFQAFKLLKFSLFIVFLSNIMMMVLFFILKLLYFLAVDKKIILWWVNKIFIDNNLKEDLLFLNTLSLKFLIFNIFLIIQIWIIITLSKIQNFKFNLKNYDLIYKYLKCKMNLYKFVISKDFDENTFVLKENLLNDLFKEIKNKIKYNLPKLKNKLIIENNICNYIHDNINFYEKIIYYNNNKNKLKTITFINNIIIKFLYLFTLLTFIFHFDNDNIMLVKIFNLYFILCLLVFKKFKFLQKYKVFFLIYLILIYLVIICLQVLYKTILNTNIKNTLNDKVGQILNLIYLYSFILFFCKLYFFLYTYLMYKIFHKFYRNKKIKFELENKEKNENNKFIYNIYFHNWDKSKLLYNFIDFLNIKNLFYALNFLNILNILVNYIETDFKYIFYLIIFFKILKKYYKNLYQTIYYKLYLLIFLIFNIILYLKFGEEKGLYTNLILINIFFMLFFILNDNRIFKIKHDSIYFQKFINSYNYVYSENENKLENYFNLINFRKYLYEIKNKKDKLKNLKYSDEKYLSFKENNLISNLSFKEKILYKFYNFLIFLNKYESSNELYILHKFINYNKNTFNFNEKIYSNLLKEKYYKIIKDIYEFQKMQKKIYNKNSQLYNKFEIKIKKFYKKEEQNKKEDHVNDINKVSEFLIENIRNIEPKKSTKNEFIKFDNYNGHINIIFKENRKLSYKIWIKKFNLKNLFNIIYIKLNQKGDIIFCLIMLILNILVCNITNFILLLLLFIFIFLNWKLNKVKVINHFYLFYLILLSFKFYDFNKILFLNINNNYNYYILVFEIFNIFFKNNGLLDKYQYELENMYSALIRIVLNNHLYKTIDKKKLIIYKKMNYFFKYKTQLINKNYNALLEFIKVKKLFNYILLNKEFKRDSIYKGINNIIKNKKFLKKSYFSFSDKFNIIFLKIGINIQTLLMFIWIFQFFYIIIFFYKITENLTNFFHIYKNNLINFTYILNWLFTFIFIWIEKFFQIYKNFNYSWKIIDDIDKNIVYKLLKKVNYEKFKDKSNIMKFFRFKVRILINMIFFSKIKKLNKYSNQHKHKANNLYYKFYFIIFYAIYNCLLIFILIPVKFKLDFSSDNYEQFFNIYVKIFYLLTLSYIFWSFIEIKYGNKIFKNSYNFMNFKKSTEMVPYNIYRFTPFIREINCILQYLSKKSSLDLFKMFVIEDILITLLNSVKLKTNDFKKKGLFIKFLLGFILVILIIIMLVFPLFYYNKNKKNYYELKPSHFVLNFKINDNNKIINPINSNKIYIINKGIKDLAIKKNSLFLNVKNFYELKEYKFDEIKSINLNIHIFFKKKFDIKFDICDLKKNNINENWIKCFTENKNYFDQNCVNLKINFCKFNRKFKIEEKTIKKHVEKSPNNRTLKVKKSKIMNKKDSFSNENLFFIEFKKIEKKNYIFFRFKEKNLLVYLTIEKMKNAFFDNIEYKFSYKILNVFVIIFSYIGISFMRNFFFNKVNKNWVLYIPNIKYLLYLLFLLRVAKDEGNIFREKYLFNKILDIFRSPKKINEFKN